MVRLTPFPFVFGGCVVVFILGFANRKRLFPEIEEIHRQRDIETRQQAAEFRVKLDEAIKKERERKAAQKKQL
jgi:hypothetical protein